MISGSVFEAAFEYFLFFSCVIILAGSVWLTIKMRFVQVRLLPELFFMLKNSFTRSGQEEGKFTIPPYKALFTAMSTTLGIGTIVAPVIAIHLGGPGALLGFLLTSFFGSAATYAEVNLCVQYRRRDANGAIMGGPMQYLKHLLSPAAAMGYAISCLVLMIVWSGAQSNQVAAILDSPLLGAFRIPKIMTGLAVGGLVIFALIGGIKRIGSLSAKLVPAMFVLYLGSSLWILISHVDQLGTVFSQIFYAALNPYSMATGTVVGGIASSLRWGIFKGIHVTEAGIGTQTFPHSMAETHDPQAQGVLAMLSTYTAGLLAFMSGCVALITGTWQDPELSLGIGMVAASFELYFSSIGTAIIAISALLFGLGTILGNSFNGSQCFGYLTQNKGAWCYFVGTGLMVFIGALTEVKTLWAATDIILAFMALLHMTGLMVYAHSQQREPVLRVVE